MHEYASVIKTLIPVIERGRSLDASWDSGASPLAKEITYGILRNYYHLNAVVGELIKKPLQDKHLDIQILILAGLYSVDHIRRPAYASVNEVVGTALSINKPWAKGIINGVLRNYLRNKDDINGRITGVEATTNHPAWLEKVIRKAWPEQADDIMVANNTHAPMTLRVNTTRTSRDEYLAALADAGSPGAAGELSPVSIYLDEPVPTDRLPFFKEGYSSVQDEASQLASLILAPEPDESILDACAAPGGKSCHILEIAPTVKLTALDIDPERSAQIRQNLKRMDIECEVITADLKNFRPPKDKFDRVLLDAPCSATGIIRRHPDIKLLRRESDIAKLVSAQIELLQAAWTVLKEGGVLVYSTCSIIPEENEGVIAAFIEGRKDARVLPIDIGTGRESASSGLATAHGYQLLPGVGGHDGFFYAKLEKLRAADAE